jgi:hypothetical protein
MRSIFLLATLILVIQAATASERLPDNEAAEIYSIVVRRLISEDDTYGGTLHPNKIYISRKLVADCPYSEPIDRSPSTVQEKLPLPAPICTYKSIGVMDSDIEHALLTALAKKGGTFNFINNRDGLQFKKSAGDIVGGGVLITLGEIVLTSPINAATNGSIFIASEAAGESRYEFKKTGGHWTLVRRLAGWIS